MIKTTREQRVALKRVYNRIVTEQRTEDMPTYRQWREFAVHLGYDCLMVEVAGMWLGIEEDGYTHP